MTREELKQKVSVIISSEVNTANEMLENITQCADAFAAQENAKLIELVKLIRNESIERKYGWSVEITCKIQKAITNT